MGLGQDQTLCYVREPEVIKCVHDDPKTYFIGPVFSPHNVWNPHAANFHITYYTVGFCGRLYPVMEIVRDSETKKFCFKLDDVVEFVAANYKDKQVESFCGKKWQRKDCWPWGRKRFDFERFFTEFEKSKDNYKKHFEEKHCPIFVGKYAEHEKTITWNGNLREVEFFRVFDPYVAFQELSMYLGSIAVPQKPVPEMSDQIKAEQHGYNEWSFRKPPKEGK